MPAITTNRAEIDDAVKILDESLFLFEKNFSTDKNIS
jgi:hypothetical protein